MNVKSDGGTKQHHYTTKSITIPYVPNGKSRDRVGAGGEDHVGIFAIAHEDYV